MSNTTYYRWREGSHGEYVIDIGFMEFTRTGSVGRAATIKDAEAIVAELNKLMREVFNKSSD